MKVLLIISLSLFCLLSAVICLCCCKVAGDSEADAERCIEEWMKSKREESLPDEREGMA